MRINQSQSCFLLSEEEKDCGEMGGEAIKQTLQSQDELQWLPLDTSLFPFLREISFIHAFYGGNAEDPESFLMM